MWYDMAEALQWYYYNVYFRKSTWKRPENFVYKSGENPGLNYSEKQGLNILLGDLNMRFNGEGGSDTTCNSVKSILGVTVTLRMGVRLLIAIIVSIPHRG